MPVRYSPESSGPSTRRAVLTPEMLKDLSYYTKTKKELQDMLEERGLPTSGNKDELIDRLSETD